MNIYILFCLLSFSSALFAQEHYIKLTNPNFKLVKDVLSIQNLNFNALPENKTTYLTYWGRNPTAEFKYDNRILVISGKTGTSQRVKLSYQNQVKTITLNLQFEPTTYNDDYISEHKDQVIVEIPEVYELTNIILALSDEFHHTNFRMHNSGSYYKDVVNKFEPFKNHENWASSVA